MLIVRECAKPIPVLNPVSVKKEPYWLETGLLQENRQTANCSQTAFGGNRILLVGDRFIAGKYARPLPVLN